jgi:hypothetical protein
MSEFSLNEPLKFAIEISQSLAKEYHNEYFYPAHLLRGLLHKEVGLKPFLRFYNGVGRSQDRGLPQNRESKGHHNRG